MIAFGVAVNDPAIFERVARPGIERAREAGSAVLTRTGHDSIQRPYNELLDEAAGIPGLEALVLLHQDLELTDASLIPRLRGLLSDPSVSLVGAVGWASPQAPGTSPEAPAFPGFGLLGPWAYTTRRREYLFGRTGLCSTGTQEVELVDGGLLALAPWVVRSLRFDERLADDFHGYDIDFSLRVRAAGGRVVCDDIPIAHRMSRLWRDRDELVRARSVVIGRWHASFRPTEWAPAFQR